MTPLNKILSFLCEHKAPTIRLNKVCAETGIKRISAKRILVKLQKEKLLRLLSEGKTALENGQTGPRRLNQNWSLVARRKYKDRLDEVGKGKPGIKRDKLWRLIRMRQTFTITDLITIASVENATASDYIKLLKKHRHIERVGRNAEGIIWHLIMKNPPVKRPNLSEKVNE